LTSSNRILALLFIVILGLSVANTYLILHYNDNLQSQRNQDIADINQAIDQTNAALNNSNSEIANLYAGQTLLSGRIDNVNALLPVGLYDFVVYKENGFVVSKNGKTGSVEFNTTDASDAFNYALSEGNSVFVKSDGDSYTLNSDVRFENKKSARLDSDGATLACWGNRILVYGDDFQHSQNNQISGFILVNGTVRIENSFKTTVTNMIFRESLVGVELAISNTWTEGTEIDTVHFDRCVQGIVFRTNTSEASAGKNSTGSYGSTALSRSYFNQLDNSVAITVERDAEWTDGQMRNVRIWIAEFGKHNQTGLLLNVNASMYQTLLDGVVFESFAKGNLVDCELYGVRIEKTVYQTPILQAGVSFLGDWTARINNPYCNWVASVGSVFKLENMSVPVGHFVYPSQPIAVQLQPQMISSFKPQIMVQGDFEGNETVIVRFRLELVDNTVTAEVEKTFNGNGSLWLSDDDMMLLYPSQNVLWAILVDAKVNSGISGVAVQISLYGTTS
jgi:hypothetical protein